MLATHSPYCLSLFGQVIKEASAVPLGDIYVNLFICRLDNLILVKTEWINFHASPLAPTSSVGPHAFHYTFYVVISVALGVELTIQLF